MRTLVALLLAGLGLASCAPSPLYLGAHTLGTPGEVPRDERGEPMWAMIPPPPPAPYGSGATAVTYADATPQPQKHARFRKERRHSADVARFDGVSVPRDASGEPVWSRIAAAPPQPAIRPFPSAEPATRFATAPLPATEGPGGQ